MPGFAGGESVSARGPRFGLTSKQTGTNRTRNRMHGAQHVHARFALERSE